MILLVWLPNKNAVLHLTRWAGPMRYQPICHGPELLAFDTAGVRETRGRQRRFEHQWPDRGIPDGHGFCRRCVNRAMADVDELEDLLAAARDRT